MKNNDLIKIDINWSLPIAIPNIESYTSKIQRGVYQISNMIDNDEELLYIGLVKSIDRTFHQRIKEHLKEKDTLQNYLESICVRFGILESNSIKISEETIEEVEGALIFQNLPSLNKSKISNYTKNNEYYIFSNGADIGNIEQEIDTRKHYLLSEGNHFFVGEYDNYEEVIEDFKNALLNGNILQLYTYANNSPFLCYMEDGKKTLWFKTSGEKYRYTTFKNIDRYFKGEQIKDEVTYVKAVGKYLEEQLRTKCS